VNTPSVTPNPHPILPAGGETRRPGAKTSLRSDHGFFSTIAILLACTIIAGFSLTAVTGGLLPPGAARLGLLVGAPQAIAGVILLFLLSGPVYDWLRYRRVYAVYVWGGLLAILTLPPELGPIAGTHAWRDVAAWLTHYR
jgi:hypothetical protein